MWRCLAIPVDILMHNNHYIVEYHHNAELPAISGEASIALRIWQVPEFSLPKLLFLWEHLLRQESQTRRLLC